MQEQHENQIEESEQKYNTGPGREAETGGSGPAWITAEFEASLGYTVRPYLREREEKTDLGVTLHIWRALLLQCHSTSQLVLGGY